MRSLGCAATGGTQRLTRLCGRAAALELCLLGAPITAQRALELGIVNRVVPAAELEAETMKLAAQLAGSAPLALRGMIDCVNIGGECGIEEGLEYEAAQFGLVFSTDDMREGVIQEFRARLRAHAVPQRHVVDQPTNADADVPRGATGDSADRCIQQRDASPGQKQRRVHQDSP